MGSKTYNDSFFHGGEISYLISQLVIEGGVVRGVVGELFPGTRYDLRVAAVNGGMRNNGIGTVSTTVTALTDSSELTSESNA